MATESSQNFALLARLADDFAERFRRGERPALAEYIEAHPELADEIRELFPAMVQIEQVKGDREEIMESVLPPPAPAVERLGDFRILREIGRGGMGIVYEAEQVSLGRRVALKVLPRKALVDNKAKRRFEREARSAAKLHHTNIVPVFGVGEQDGLPYYVMQFIQGLGLDDVLEELKRVRKPSMASTSVLGADLRVSPREVSANQIARSLLTGEQNFAAKEALGGDATEPAPEPTPAGFAQVEQWDVRAPSVTDSSAQASSSVVLPGRSRDGNRSRYKKQTYWHSVANIGVQVAEALDYAHKQGIYHRDIKPSNLLLDARATVWVADFGLAKADDQPNLTHTGDILGTLRYMPPEAFDGRTDARGDIYSLGLTLYELLAFRPAFHDDDRNRLIKLVAQQEPERLRKLNRDVPRDLETIVTKAIEKEPTQRYQTAAELRDDLVRFLDDEPILARRASLAERLVRWVRRNQSIAAALGVVALLLLVLTVGSALAAAFFRAQERAQRRLANRNEDLAVAMKGLAEERGKLADDMARLAGEKENERAIAEKAKNDALAARKLSEERGQELRRNLYFSEMNQAGQAVHRPGGPRRTQEILATWRELPDIRGWEWYYLSSLCNRERLKLVGHEDGARTVAYSPDGKWLASGSRDATAKIWDAETGTLAMTLSGYDGSVEDVAFSPDGALLATASTDKTIKIWDLARRGPEKTLRGHRDRVLSVDWSPDGSRLFSGSDDGTIRIWDVGSGKTLATIGVSGAHLWWVRCSPDGTQLASAGPNNTIQTWDAISGKKVRSFTGHTKDVNGIAWSPDGRRLASTAWDYTVRVWDANTGALLRTLRGHTAWWLSDVAWSADGKRLASAGSWDETIRVWDPDKGEELMTLRGHTGHTWGVSWNPDGTRLASSSWDGTIRVWDVSRVPIAKGPGKTAGGVRSLSWQPDRRSVLVARADGSISIEQRNTSAPRPIFHDREAKPWCAVWSPDGKHIASGGDDKRITIRDSATGQKLITLEGHQKVVRSLSWKPDGSQLASASDDGTARVWDAASGRELKTYRLEHDGGFNEQPVMYTVAWSPDGKRLASGGNDKQVYIWQEGALRVVLSGHTDRVLEVAWSADGRFLASAGGDDTVRLWDVAAQKATHVLRGHTSRVTSVAWSPSGERIASAGWDGTVKLWDPTTAALALSIPLAALGDAHVVWSADGTMLVTAGDDGVVLFHDAVPGIAPELSPVLLPELNRRLKGANADPDDFKLRGQILARSGEWEKAAADFEHYFAQKKGKSSGVAATGWSVAGPYPEGLWTPCAPEFDIKVPGGDDQSSDGSPSASKGGAAEVTWRTAVLGPDGMLDLGSFMNRADHISAYARTFVYSPRRQELALLVGSDNGRRVWVNGRICEDKRFLISAIPDDDAVCVTLNAGWNSVLVKVSNPWGPHELYLRFSDAPADRLRAIRNSGDRDDQEKLVEELLEQAPRDPQALTQAAIYSRDQAERIERGKVSPWLGVFHAAVGHGTTRPTDRPDVPGVRVARVAPGSAAERAGIRPSDLIVRLNQKPIGSAEDLHSALASLRPQSHVVVDIVRGDRSLSLEAFLGERTEALPTQENTADEAASAGDRGNARSAERQSRAERCRRLARSLYERLIEIEPYDWAHVNALSDFLLASSAPWFETKSGAISLPFEAKSEAGVILTRLADGSFLASGKNPKSDTYTLRFRAATRGFQILRFDVLPDPSLPHAGSGRSPLGNFVLSQIQVEAEGKILPLQAVSASFSQVGFPFDVVVNPQVVASSGWAIAPRMGQPQSAYFVLDSRSISSDEVPLTLRLSFKSQFEYHTMGRFRLALSRPIPSRPAEQLLAAHTLAALETRGWTRLAMIHALRGEWLEAAGACQKEIDRDPEKGSRLLAFASLLLYESGRKSEARRKLDEAISWLKSNESAPAERALAALALSRVAARNDVEIQSVLAEIAGQGRRRELTRAIEAEPKNVALYSARAEFHARRGEWQQAAVDLRKSYELDAQVNPRADIQLARLGNMLLLAGDRDAYERLCQEKLRQQGRFPSEAAAANGVVWLFCLAPGATADYRDLVSLMEKTVQAASQAERVAYLSNTLGAILYRAGRYREALERLTEGQAATKVDPAPQDLAFLALVHERLGNAAEARRWRDRLRAYPTPGDAPSNAFWNNLEIPVLLKEVESVVAGP